LRIESSQTGSFRVTLHAYELSALVAAARWAVEGAEGELSPGAREQLRKVLSSYDDELRRVASTGRAEPGEPT
jgi:hypothetical protein